MQSASSNGCGNTGDGRGLFAVYLGEGYPADFGGFNVRAGQSLILAESRSWHSATPYIPTRHPKLNKRGEPKCDAEGNWIDSPEMQLRTELERRGLPQPLRIVSDANPKWRHFATRRKQGEGARIQSGGHRISHRICRARTRSHRPWLWLPLRLGPVCCGGNDHPIRSIKCPTKHKQNPF